MSQYRDVIVITDKNIIKLVRGAGGGGGVEAQIRTVDGERSRTKIARTREKIHDAAVTLT